MGREVKTRFEGEEGRRRLLDLLKHQRAISHDEALARRILEVADIQQHEVGAALMQQEDGGNDLCFLLMGSVDVFVNGQRVATRSAGEHLGEMAAIDPKAKRSATVRATEVSVAAWVTEATITRIADEHPSLWRGFARGLADRLRERASLLRTPNSKPRIFLGSSAEGLSVANAIQAGLSHDRMLVKLWTNHVFASSSYTLDDLLLESAKADFAVFVVLGEDMTKSRGTESVSPRDNVVLELGIFMGALGRTRSLIVRPRGADLKIPSDLLGLNVIDYDATVPLEDLSSVLGPVCTEIRGVVSKHGPR